MCIIKYLVLIAWFTRNGSPTHLTYYEDYPVSHHVQEGESLHSSFMPSHIFHQTRARAFPESAWKNIHYEYYIPNKELHGQGVASNCHHNHNSRPQYLGIEPYHTNSFIRHTKTIPHFYHPNHNYVPPSLPNFGNTQFGQTTTNSQWKPIAYNPHNTIVIGTAKQYPPFYRPQPNPQLNSYEPVYNVNNRHVQHKQLYHTNTHYVSVPYPMPARVPDPVLFKEENGGHQDQILNDVAKCKSSAGCANGNVFGHIIVIEPTNRVTKTVPEKLPGTIPYEEEIVDGEDQRLPCKAGTTGCAEASSPQNIDEQSVSAVVPVEDTAASNNNQVFEEPIQPKPFPEVTANTDKPEEDTLVPWNGNTSESNNAVPLDETPTSSNNQEETPTTPEAETDVISSESNNTNVTSLPNPVLSVDDFEVSVIGVHKTQPEIPLDAENEALLNIPQGVE